MLHSMQSIHLGSRATNVCALLHVLARWTQIPATTTLHLPQEVPAAAPRLAVKGWGRGWLPAVLAAAPRRHMERAVVVAVDDSDVHHYLSSVAPMSPSQQQTSSHVLWLGEQVSDAGFSRLLGCAQQPPLRLEVDAAAQGQRLQGYVLEWEGAVQLSSRHFRALCGLAAPRLVSLALAGCEQLTNQDVTMLAGACHELKDLKLLGACKLTDAALHSLAAGCRHLERVQITHASVTEEGVGVALAMLGQLKRLEVGGVPLAWLQQLEGVVLKQMASGRLQWSGSRGLLAGPHGDETSIVWSRK
jgi:hypothetical protein